MAKFRIGQLVRVKFVFNPENRFLVGKEFVVKDIGSTPLFLFGEQTMYELTTPPTDRYSGFLEEQLEAARPDDDFDTRFMVEKLVNDAEDRVKISEAHELSTSKELVHVPAR
jgi:hypothetical protein